jgi:hypothetical protein
LKEDLNPLPLPVFFSVFPRDVKVKEYYMPPVHNINQIDYDLEEHENSKLFLFPL